jgi:hypothetical protein
MSDVTVGILVLIIVLVLHLVEEVKTGFRRNSPFGEMPLPLFIGINVLVYGFCATTLGLSFRGSAAAVPLAWIFAIAMALNGLGHLGIMVVRGKYYPGGLSAPALILVSVYLMSKLAAA